ncbi:MAG TPA: amidohydrolase family protein [Acidimicrobiales bacterium]|nr:amidohydrolase family protein [Acidimicrobiales bacterium]
MSGSTPKVDTHTHVVSDDLSRHPVRPTGLGSQWWADPGLNGRSLLQAMDAGGVARALLVQPIGAYGYDCSSLLETASTSSGRLLAVPAVDLDDRAADALRAMGASSLVSVLTVFDHQLEDLLPVIGKSDGLVALDHCGFPELVEGRVPVDAPLWRTVSMAHVSLKITSHLLKDAGTGVHQSRLVEDLLAHFGADRLMWGSDYPQSGTDFPGLIGMAEDAVGWLGEDDRTAFFSANAERVFF